MNTFERQVKLANKEVELFVGYCDIILHKKLKYTFDDDITDVEDNKLWSVNFDGVSIVSNKDFNEFEVGHEVWYPGNYYEPDSSDYTEDSKHPTLREAMWEVLKIWLQFDYNNFLESQWAEECINETEEGYEDKDKDSII